MHLLRNLCFSLFALLPVASAMAQTPEDSVSVANFKVLDAFFEEPIASARVAVYEADGVTCICDSLPPHYILWSRGDGIMHKDKMGFKGRLPRRDAYAFCVMAEGYRTQWLNVALRPKDDVIHVGDVEMYDAPAQTFGEATVTASRVKMITRGDTLVFNAAAFNLPEGSMLDDLIAALPGASIDKQGQITVNGEPVAELLVDGRDFFKGDPNVALKNLSAYMVKRLEVYRQTPKHLQGIERSEKEKLEDPLVMDVKLKREYAQGWIANAEAAGGMSLGGNQQASSQEFWLGRAFGMRYTNHSQLAIYGNANNLSDVGTPNRGFWSKRSAGDGNTRTLSGGINWGGDFKKRDLNYGTSFNVTHTRTDLEQRTVSETYLPTRNVRETSSYISKPTATHYRWNGSIHKGWKGKSWLYINAAVGYTDGETAGSDTQVQDSLWQRLQMSTMQTKNLDCLLSPQFFWMSVPFCQYVNIDATASWCKRKSDTRLSDVLTYTSSTENNLDQARSTGQRTENYRLSASAKFERFGEKKRKLPVHTFLYYSFNQAFDSGNRELWTLDRLASASASEPSASTSEPSASTSEASGWNAKPFTHPFLTPSATRSEGALRDDANSYHTTTLTRTHFLNPEMWWDGGEHFSGGIQLSTTFTNRQLDDWRGAQGTGLQSLRKTECFLEPYADLNVKSKHYYTSWSYKLHQSPVSLSQLLDVFDDSDPLRRTQGNPHLRRGYSHDFGMKVKCSDWQSRQQFNANAQYVKTNRMVGTAQIYDPATGIYTSMPLNINGNWSATASASYRGIFGKEKQFVFFAQTSGNLYHSVDFSSDTEVLSSQAVDNVSVNGNCNFTLTVKEWDLRGEGNISWRRLYSDERNFQSQGFFDHTYGISASGKLIWGITLYTELKLYLKRGYADAQMNTTEWVWNATLSRAWKNWTVRAVGYDLLHQLSNVRRNIDAQGRTETWYNSIPAYATLHIVYRMEAKPRKRGLGKSREN